jgi:hypothetical protein
VEAAATRHTVCGGASTRPRGLAVYMDTKVVVGGGQSFQPESNPQQPTSLQRHCHRLRDHYGRERVWRLIAQVVRVSTTCEDSDVPRSKTMRWKRVLKATKKTGRLLVIVRSSTAHLARNSRNTVQRRKRRALVQF